MRELIHFQCKGRRKMSGVTSKLHLAMFLVAAVVMLQGVDAQADFTSDVTITGSVEYYLDLPDFPYADNATIGGSFSTTEGGVPTTSIFDGTGVTGVNPLPGTLTALLDGFAMTAGAAGNSTSGDSEFGLGLDLLLDITNNSATTDYWITFDLAFSNSVTSLPGPDTSPIADAYADTVFSLFDSDYNEIFFTDLTSDGTIGNMENGVDTGSYGGILTDSGTFSFGILLGPGLSTSYEGYLTMDGGAYASSYEADFSADLTVTNVVPVPGAVLLGSIGLGFAGCLLRRFKDRD